MLKLLIVDDEEKVCQLIEYIIDWHNYGIDIIGIANDGQTAFEMITQHRPNIIITDIRMPMYDGIELIKKTRELDLEISFIIISGYSQFEYAKNAIKYGVANYLLKPIQKKELVATIQKILDKYALETEFENEKKKLINLIEDSKKTSRSNFIRDYFINKSHAVSNQIPKESIKAINEKYSCSFGNGDFLLLIIRPFLAADKDDDKLWELLISKTKAHADERLQKNIIDKVVLVNDRDIAYFLNIQNGSMTQIKKALQGIIIDSLSLTKIFGDMHTRIGISDIVQEFSGMPDLYFQAECALLNRFTLKDSLLTYNADYSEIERTSFLDRKRRNQIISAFESHNQAHAIEQIESVYNFIKEEKLKGIEVIHCYNELVECIAFSVNTYLPSCSFPELSQLMEKLHKVYSLRDVVNHLKRIVHETFFTMKESESKPIRAAKDYIYQNYNSNLSQRFISEKLGFNVSYFSSLFKKETGENFMDFVIKVRIDFAKQYLEQTELEVFEIAEKVGYSDLKYFNRIFKKNVHLTPLEYRKVYG